jgi:hypothetical protein
VPAILNPQEDSGAQFCYRASQPQVQGVARRTASVKKLHDRIGNLTHDLPICSSMPPPTMLQHAAHIDGTLHIYGFIKNNRGCLIYTAFHSGNTILG